MIQENDILALINNEFVSLGPELDMVDDRKSPYKLLALFAGFTIRAIGKNDSREIKKCFTMAEHLLDDGNFQVQKAVICVYLVLMVPSLSVRSELAPFIPRSLYFEYKKQEPLPV